MAEQIKENKIKKAERILAESAGRRHALLTGSGTTALMLACQLGSRDRPKVIVPGIVCSQVLYAVLYAGKIPVFADVRLQDATLDPEHVALLLATDPSIGAVIAVHLYGHRADMEALSVLTRPRGVLLIEDAAQAQGGLHPDGRLFGSAGDLSIISFGHTKIIDVGGGGVLLFDDPTFFDRSHRYAAELPPAPDNMFFLSKQYSRLFYAAWEAYRTDQNFAVLFDSFPELFRRLFVFSTNESQAQKIIDALPNLPDERAHRCEFYKVYCDALRNVPGVILFDVDITKITPWRCSFRVPRELRDKLLSAMRGANYNASSWYPCISDWTPAGRNPRVDLPVSRKLESEIVNLWLTRDHSTVMVQNMVAMIAQIF